MIDFNTQIDAIHEPLVTRETLAGWLKMVISSSDRLRVVAATTEGDFLSIGARMQDFYQRSTEITAMAHSLVVSVSGEECQMLIDRLRHMMVDMETYLVIARKQSHESCTALARVLDLIDGVSEPLASFNKMTKTLRMLGVSTKIESSRLGEMGIGFQTLAMDVEKLSQLVSDKSCRIMGHRQLLASMITGNLHVVRQSEAMQDAQMKGVIADTSHNLEELVAVNSRCNSFGSLVASVSGEVSRDIGEVVSSMQMHDMTRQQIEHIVEALERLSASLEESSSSESTAENLRGLVVEAGDVCELQSAQLRFSTSELYRATESIISNLRDVAAKQAQLMADTLNISGVSASGGGSFMDAMSLGLGTITSVLAKCTESGNGISATLASVTDTMQEVGGFVTDIEQIGSAIDLIAFNAQIKAAHTGHEGAALGVLAEAIKRLSVDAITQAEAVSGILYEINNSTGSVYCDAENEIRNLSDLLNTMGNDLSVILEALGSMNNELVKLLASLSESVASLKDDIEETTLGINVHESIDKTTCEVMAELDRIVKQSRECEPASSEFISNLHHMEDRYTMESERYIHESIARKRSGQGRVEKLQTVIANADSRFDDNVELF